jgi:hypothetical protein
VSESENGSEKKYWLQDQVARLPLERFRLPTDGQRWRGQAMNRRHYLYVCAKKGNRDGTFLRHINGNAQPSNCSPREEELLKEFTRASSFRYKRDLWKLDLLDWADDGTHKYGRGHRQIWQITVDAPYPEELCSQNKGSHE